MPKKSSKKPKEILEKCKDKKLRNLRLVNLIEKNVTQKTLWRIEDCSTFLQFLGNRDLSKKKLLTSNFCGNRFCSFCAWRKSLKEALQVRICMKHLKSEEGQEFYFLTLTTPNVVGDELDDEIKHYNTSFKRLMQIKEVKDVINGYARKLEITYNSDEFITEEMYKKMKAYFSIRGLKVGDKNPNYNTYHPHFHVILCVDFNKFKYQKQPNWLELWKEATRNKDITQVKCDRIDMDVAASKEALEIAKYASKDSDYLHSQSVFDIFYKSLKGKRILVYSGNFKDAVEMYKNKELEMYKDVDTEEYIYLLMYSWSKNNYKESHQRELTEEEYKKYNKKLNEEVEDDTE